MSLNLAVLPFSKVPGWRRGRGQVASLQSGYDHGPPPQYLHSRAAGAPSAQQVGLGFSDLHWKPQLPSQQSQRGLQMHQPDAPGLVN